VRWEEDQDVFLMRDENGVERRMAVAATFEAEGRTYALLLDLADPEADGVLCRLEAAGGSFRPVAIEDEEEWRRVESAYERLHFPQTGGRA